MARQAQPKPFGPNDLVVAPGKPGFTELVHGELADVGAGKDTFDQDFVASKTSLDSVPHALKAVDDAIQEAHNQHEALRRYDAGVPGLYAQAQGAVAKTAAAFEQALVIPGTPPAQTAPPVIVKPKPTGGSSTAPPPGPSGGPGGPPRGTGGGPPPTPGQPPSTSGGKGPKAPGA